MYRIPRPVKVVTFQTYRRQMHSGSWSRPCPSCYHDRTPGCAQSPLGNEVEDPIHSRTNTPPGLVRCTTPSSEGSGQEFGCIAQQQEALEAATSATPVDQLVVVPFVTATQYQSFRDHAPQPAGKV